MSKVCQIDDCSMNVKARGWCRLHYERWKYNGDPNVCQTNYHGLAKESNQHSLYSTWKALRQRCNNPRNVSYPGYGGRGIKVCDRWSSFDLFVEDMGKKPTPEHSIDRINNDGDYTPENCRWATRTEQNINQRVRKDNSTGIRGVAWYKNYSKWVVKIRVNKKIIHIGYFDNLQEAVAERLEAEKLYWQIDQPTKEYING